MLDYLFRSIPGILFEPFAVFMLLWLTVVSICFPRKEKVMFRFIFFSLIFMVAWRLGFHRIMLSSRYASGLILPVIVCSAWLCIKIPPLLYCLFRKVKTAHQGKSVFRLLPVIIISGLAIASVCKSLRVDSYSAACKLAAETYLSKRSEKEGKIYCVEKELKRIAWYCRRNFNDFNVLPDSGGKNTLQGVRNTVEKLKDIPGEHWLFFFVKKNEIMPTSASMQLPHEYGKFEILAKYHNSSRKNKEIVVARYVPAD